MTRRETTTKLKNAATSKRDNEKKHVSNKGKERRLPTKWSSKNEEFQMETIQIAMEWTLITNKYPFLLKDKALKEKLSLVFKIPFMGIIFLPTIMSINT